MSPIIGVAVPAVPLILLQYAATVVQLVVAVVPSAVDMEGADFAVDGSGVRYYQDRLMQSLRKYGQMNFSGHTPGAKLELSPLHHVLDPARTIFGQHDVRAVDRKGLVRSLLDERVQQMIDVMVTHEFPLSEANEAFRLQASKECGKIYLRMD